MITYPVKLYKKLVESTGIPEDDIKDAVFFFWRTGVLDALNNFDKPEIFIKGLGSFHVKQWVLNYKIPQLTQFIKDHPEHQHIEYLTQHLSKMVKAQTELDKIKQDKKEFDEHSRNIQEQKQDLGRTTEQNI